MKNLMIFACLATLSFQSLSSASGDQKSANMLVQKGSGLRCPALSGLYRCSVTVEEQQAGRTDYRLGIAQSTNASGMPILNIGGAEFIADGDVHDRQGDGASLKYSVDCREHGASIHATGSQGQDVKMDFVVTARGHLAFSSSGVVNGESKTENRSCISQ